jgi:hypothetical protein
MDYTIYPYEGVGPIKFGMTPQQVHEILGAPERQIPASTGRNLPKDKYVELGFFVCYQNPGVCEAVELFEGANPSLQGNLLLNQSLKELKFLLVSMGSDIQYSTSGFISFKYGLSFYSSYYNPQLLCKSDSVCVFKQDYFNQVAETLSRKYPKEEAKA